MWANYGLIIYICFMATIKFILQSKSETAGIYVRLKEGRLIDVKAKTKYIINSDNWSTKKGRPSNLKDNALKKLDKDLIDFQADLLEHYNNTSNKLEINTQWLKEFINPPKKIAKLSNKLIEFIEYYLTQNTTEKKESTLKRAKSTKNLIQRFESGTKSTFLIKDIDPDYIAKFVRFCYDQNYSQNTTARAVKFLKTICYFARTKDIETSPKLDLITPPKIDAIEKIYLTPEEITKIENTTYETESLNNAKDWLIISIETGQRVSDFLRFTKDMIRAESGKSLIEFTQVKTNKIMTVPLSKKVLQILKKRKGNFPRPISDQKCNDYFKDVCRIAGINEKTKGSIVEVIGKEKIKRKKSGIFEKWELVSTRIGRRTFATNNYGKIPTSLLISATGHSTEAMFLVYIGKSNKDKALQLAEYF
jgi:integrase